MNRVSVIDAALRGGWEFDPTGLYDEEGIEGFIWRGPNGEELTSPAVGGEWDNGPEVPDEIRLVFDPAFAAEVKRIKEINREFATFLERLQNKN